MERGNGEGSVWRVACGVWRVACGVWRVACGGGVCVRVCVWFLGCTCGCGCPGGQAWHRDTARQRTRQCVCVGEVGRGCGRGEGAGVRER